METHFNIRVLGLPLAQGRWMDPAALRKEQSTVFEGHAGAGLGLGLIEDLEQLGTEGSGQLGLAFGLFLVEGQLQDAAVVPVEALVQLFEQAPGMPEAAENQL